VFDVQVELEEFERIGSVAKRCGFAAAQRDRAAIGLGILEHDARADCHEQILVEPGFQIRILDPLSTIAFVGNRLHLERAALRIHKGQVVGRQSFLIDTHAGIGHGVSLDQSGLTQGDNEVVPALAQLGAIPTDRIVEAAGRNYTEHHDGESDVGRCATGQFQIAARNAPHHLGIPEEGKERHPDEHQHQQERTVCAPGSRE